MAQILPGSDVVVPANLGVAVASKRPKKKIPFNMQSAMGEYSKFGSSDRIMLWHYDPAAKKALDNHLPSS